MPCKKDKGKMCGAGWRNSVFQVDKVEKTKLITYEHTTLLGETYVGCFADGK
jgi:hypothetical protein